MKEKAFKLLMILQGLLWIYMTIQSVVSDKAAAIILGMMALDGIFYILLAFADIRQLLYRLVVLAFLGTNAILSITDQMGFFDYLVLSWNVVLLILVCLIIVKQRKKQ